MENEPLLIQCECHGECHGECYSAVLCGHLIHHNGKPLGIIGNPSNPTNYQA